MRQACPKSAREFLRQRVIGMLRIFRRAADLIHVPHGVPRGSLAREARHDVGMFLRDIKPVERVEQRKLVALRQQEWLPVLP